MLARGEKEINQLLLKFVCCRFAFGFSGPPLFCYVRYVCFRGFLFSWFLFFVFFCLFWFSCSLVFYCFWFMMFLFLFLLSLLLLLPSFLLVAKTPAEARFTFTTWSSLNNIYFNCAGWDKEQRATRVSKKGTQKKNVKEQLKGETWKWMDTMVASW